MSSGAGILGQVSTSFLFFLHELLEGPPYAKHQEQVAADPTFQQTIFNILLTCCLPAAVTMVPAEIAAGKLGGGRGARLLHCLPSLFGHPSLACGARQYLRATSAGLGVMQAATELVEALPLRRPAGMAANVFVELHTRAVALLAVGAAHMAEQASGSGGAAAAGPAANASSALREQTAWRLMALVPRLSNVIKALADEVDAASSPASSNSLLCSLEAACSGVAYALAALSCIYQRTADQAQLASWVAAATAELSLQPLLLRLDAGFQQLRLQPGGFGKAYAGAQLLSRAFLAQLWNTCPLVGGDTLPSSLALPLWGLYGSAARLCHFLAGQGSLALAGTSSLADMDRLTRLLDRQSLICDAALGALDSYAQSLSG